ncbi:TetR/AcrR family transcriptional regulator [Chryseobacterium ginsengisoli]|uniref:TetR/AcrR family transcriptional regulator n=1 Tax=Chryseobacterium ginsengisoli TaxID=363853 RepID=A0ABP9M4S9_9FLAO
MSEKMSVKERIVETTARLFYHQGFNNTGINQIIAEANIAIGSLYNHFKSKEDLLLNYLEQEEITFFSNLDLFMKDEQKPEKKLLKFIDYRIQLQKQAGYSGCHFIKINAEIGRENEKVATRVINHKQKQRDYLKNLIQSFDSNSNLSKENLANIIFLMIEGAVASSSIKGNTQDLEVLRKTILELI